MPGIIVKGVPSDDAPASSPTSGAEAEQPQLLQAPPPHPSSRPRPDRTTVRNRRLQYLAKHTHTYFRSPDLELADPLLYDRLIRQHQTAPEREAEGRAKGWSGILHADLSRSEAKVAALRDNTDTADLALNSAGQPVGSKEEAEAVWRGAMTLRFIEGRDEEADYESIDNSEEYDDYRQIERDAQDAYFDAESPSPCSEGAGVGDTGVQDF